MRVAQTVGDIQARPEASVVEHPGKGRSLVRSQPRIPCLSENGNG